MVALSPEEHNLLVTKTIDLVNGSVEKKRGEILEYFHKVFLFALGLTSDDVQLVNHILRQPRCDGASCI
jgi:hypothetical protein